MLFKFNVNSENDGGEEDIMSSNPISEFDSHTDDFDDIVSNLISKWTPSISRLERRIW